MKTLQRTGWGLVYHRYDTSHARVVYSLHVQNLLDLYDPLLFAEKDVFWDGSFSKVGGQFLGAGGVGFFEISDIWDTAQLAPATPSHTLPGDLNWSVMTKSTSQDLEIWVSVP